MAYGGVLIQSPVQICSDHEHEELTVLCYTCIQRICDTCVKTKHIQHDWISLANIIRKVRMNSKERENALLEILSDLQEAALERETEDEVQRVRITDMSKISMSHDHASKLAQTPHQVKEGRDSSVEVTELEKMIHFFSNEVTDSPATVIFEMEEAFLKMCQIHKTRQQKPLKSSPKLKEVKISEEAINIFGKIIRNRNDNNKDDREGKDDHREEINYFNVDGKKVAEKSKHSTYIKYTTNEEDEGNGDLVWVKHHYVSLSNAKSSVREINSFTTGTKMIVTIAPISATKAWIHKCTKRQNKCVDIDGHVTNVKTLGGLIDDFIVLDNNDFIHTGSDMKVKCSSQSDKVRNVCSTDPLHPRGICSAHDGGILVCLCECDTPKMTPDTRGEIHHMTLSGKINRKYTRSEDGKTKLFTIPNRVVQNINKDICVVDFIDKDFTSRLVVLTVESVLRFVYMGQSTMKKRFVSENVCCDTYGRILVIDYLNYAVHQLSFDGQFLQFLLTGQDLYPNARSLAVHRDHLWIGCERGVVKVYKYR